MDIQTNGVKSTPVEKNSKTSVNSKVDNQSQISSDYYDPSSKISQVVDKATGLLQTIVSDPLSEKVIRKMPTDEYLQLLSLLDKMIAGSIDNKV